MRMEADRMANLRISREELIPSARSCSRRRLRMTIALSAARRGRAGTAHAGTSHGMPVVGYMMT